jgi:dienelactone hydrolase
MKLQPRLIDVHVPKQPDGVVLVLHGGASRRRMMVSPAQLSVLRMVPLARRIAGAASDRLATFRLLNSRRGWDAEHTPVRDANWALDEIRERLGAGPACCLVGHSLGGRAAILAAPRPEVVSVVALAPWVYPTDVPRTLDGERVLIVHGSRDRIASPRRSAALASRLGRRARAGYVLVHGATHAMLRRHEVFSGLAAGFALQTLLEPDLNAQGGFGPSAAVQRTLERIGRGCSYVEV